MKAPKLSSIPEDRPFPCLFFRTVPYAEGGTKRTRFCVVNTQDGLTEMVEAIVSQDKVALYVAVEASLLVLHVHPQLDCSYVVDLQSLGTTAFESCEASRAREGIKALEAGKTLSPAQVAAAKAEVEETSGEPRIRSCGKWQQGSPLPSLKAVLEGKSPSVPKVLFDCSQALTLAQKRQWVVNSSTKRQEEAGGEAAPGIMDFLAQDGALFGGAAAWDMKSRARPLPIEIALYCVEQVRHLPGLREKYSGRLDGTGWEAARLRTQRRLEEVWIYD
ncbi:hypothetical protein UCDDA912_g02139 [Diaporthe ampelina]|uniref:Uncharacterized protein n=1 Tax=Diaporthe ampelina TaxID=1214573 RepID=A0A0G2FUT7_9PEZI|nr:hypothetical protein UCDDA912_g02139 [Diaporthe ampelina]